MSAQRQRQRLTALMQDIYGTQAEYLWADSPDSAVFRHPASGKWYALILRVRPERLGLPAGEAVDVLDMKCNSIMIGSLLGEKGFLPAYHMNKNHWIAAVLDGSVPDGQLLSLLELSYNSVAPRRRRAPEQAERI